MNCHLLIPGLFLPRGAGAGPYDGLALPAVETLLARGALLEFPGMSLERWLAAAFRVAPQHDLPLAPLALRGDGGDPGTDCWLQADPVHLRVYRDELVLADAGSFEIVAREAAEMIAALNAHFAQDGLEFVAPVPQRWYARVRADPRIRTTPTAEVAGRGIERFLPTGDDGPRWRRLSNEAQMLLHQLPCNEARETRRELVVNSVWLWGAGRMPDVPRDAPYGTIWSSHPLAAGLAAAAGLALRALPPSATQLIETLREVPGPGLIVLDGLRDAAGAGAQAWRAAVADLERLWFAPLLDALGRGAVPAVTLHALGPHCSCTATTTRLDRLKFWRPRRPLHDYAKAAAE